MPEIDAMAKQQKRHLPQLNMASFYVVSIIAHMLLIGFGGDLLGAQPNVRKPAVNKQAPPLEVVEMQMPKLATEPKTVQKPVTQPKTAKQTPVAKAWPSPEPLAPKQTTRLMEQPVTPMVKEERLPMPKLAELPVIPPTNEQRAPLLQPTDRPVAPPTSEQRPFEVARIEAPAPQPVRNELLPFVAAPELPKLQPLVVSAKAAPMLEAPLSHPPVKQSASLSVSAFSSAEALSKPTATPIATSSVPITEKAPKPLSPLANPAAVASYVAVSPSGVRTENPVKTSYIPFSVTSPSVETTSAMSAVTQVAVAAPTASPTIVKPAMGASQLPVSPAVSGAAAPRTALAPATPALTPATPALAPATPALTPATPALTPAVPALAQPLELRHQPLAPLPSSNRSPAPLSQEVQLPVQPQVKASAAPTEKEAVQVRVQPIYPANARRRGLEGTVKLAVTVASSGRATEIRVAASSGRADFDLAAQEAVRQWRFVPPSDGSASYQVTVTVDFRLTD